MFTSRDQKRMNIDDGPQSARQKKSCVQQRCQDAKPVEICWDVQNSPTDLSRQWAEVHHIVKTYGGDIAI